MPTKIRTFIAALFPAIGFGTVPVLKPETSERSEWMLAANLTATVIALPNARQKVQGQVLAPFILEQLPVFLSSGVAP